MTTNDPRADWVTAQQAIFEEIRTHGRPQSGYFAPVSWDCVGPNMKSLTRFS